MKTLRLLTVGAFAVAFAATLLPRTQAYSKTGYKWPTMTVSFYVNPSNQDVSATAATAAIQAGLAAWSTQAGTPFRYSYAGQVSSTTTGYDKKNVIVFRNTTNGGAIATSYWWHSSGSLLDSDIILWDGARKFFTGASGCSSGTQLGAYIEDVVTHELGHSLGLGHSGVNEATMYASYLACSQAMRSLASDDISGARSLYGTSGSTSGTTDTAPTVRVLAPANGSSVASGTTIAFSGSASDTPDGTISSRLVWRSSRDGQIGTGASFSRTLTAGSHTITASVTDSTGHTAQASVGVTVTTTSTTTTTTSGRTLTATKTTQSDGRFMTKLSWTGLTTDTVDMYRNGEKIDRTGNDGSANNYVPGKGTYTYKMCNSRVLECTNQASVTY